MRRFEVTASTMGRPNPSHLGTGNWYRWNGDPGKSDAATGYAPAPKPGTSARQAQRQQRLDAFAAALKALGAPDPATAPADLVTEAGRQVGVRDRTARTYRTELKRQQGRGR